MRRKWPSTRRLRRALQKSEEKYRSIFENAVEGIFQTTPEGHFITVNPAMASMHGFASPEEIIAGITDIGTQLYLNPEDRERYRVILEEKGEVNSFEAQVYRKDGNIVWTSTNARAIKDAYGNISRFEGTVEDITARKLTDEKLIENKNELQWLFKSMINAFVLFESVFNEHGNFVSYRFVYTNDAYEQITGVKNDEVRGKTVHEVWPETEPSWIENYGAVAVTGIPRSFDMYHKPTDKLYCCNVYRPWNTTDRFCVIFEDITERKKAEEALQKSEEQFCAIADYTYDWENWVGPDGKLIWINPAVLRLTGHSVNECLAMNDFPALLFDKTDRERMARLFAEAVQGISCENVEFRIQCKDGNIKWGGVSCQPIYSAIGTNIGHRSSIRDITERKLAEEELKASERKYRTLIEQLPDFIWHKDLNGVYVSCNRHYAEAVGFTPETIVGHRDEDFYPPELVAKYIADDQSVIATGQPIETEEMWLENGNKRWMYTSKAALLDESGQCIGTIGVTRDITDRKQVEDTLTNNEAQLRAILDATPFPIALVDLEDNNIYFWSHSALTLFGHTAPTAPEWYQIAYPDSDYRHKVIDRWKPFLEIANKSRQTVNTGEYRVTCSDGSVRICELYAAFLTDKLVVTFNDITSRKQAEEALRASLHEKDLLINEVHHRVKNNMQVISGLLDLQARLAGNPELTEMLSEGQRRIRAMALIHEKLYETKDFTRVDLAQYVRALSQELFQAYKINPGKIDLIIQTDGAVHVDISKANPCGLILNELISNAFKHAFPGDKPGKLEIIIHETKDKEIEILVRDNGSGMPDDVDIYQPRSAGLYLLNGLVMHQLDGQIEVIRDAGTAFRVTLPLLSAKNKGVVQ